MVDRVVLLTAAAAGGAGVATGTVTSGRVISGKILAVHLRYIGSPPAATADVTLKDGGKTVPTQQTILSITDAATDGWFYPRVPVKTNANVAITYDNTRPVHEHYVVSDHLVLTLAQADNDDQVEATVYFEH